MGTNVLKSFLCWSRKLEAALISNSSGSGGPPHQKTVDLLAGKDMRLSSITALYTNHLHQRGDEDSRCHSGRR